MINQILVHLQLKVNSEGLIIQKQYRLWLQKNVELDTRENETLKSACIYKFPAFLTPNGNKDHSLKSDKTP